MLPPLTSIPDQPSGPLKEAFVALRSLENVRFEQIQEEKKNFEVLHNVFKKMKGLNNEHLPEYVKLQRQIVSYLYKPQFVNYYKVHDKKLTKNTVKRCFIDPFCEKFMKSTDDTSPLGTELAKYKDVP